MHDSGRMLLALYANGVLRLWNLLDARCLFKRKVGLSADEEEEPDSEDEEDKKENEKEKKPEQPSEETKKVLDYQAKMNNRAL